MEGLMDIPLDEQGFLNSIKKSPDDLTTHLAYADWLVEHEHKSRSDVLRAWIGLIQAPLSAADMPRALEAYKAYRNSLYQKDGEWITAMDEIRPWITKPVAEKIV